MVTSYQMLVNILDEQMGFVILAEEHDDFAISGYVHDSLAFVQFLVTIEETLHVDLPDEFLDFDLLSSARGFAEKLDVFLTERVTADTI